MRKTVTVFGSSKPTEGEEQYQFALDLGRHLAENNFDVCTGGFYGIMEAVSKGAKEKAAETIGITIDRWGGKPNKYVTREIRCDTLFERVEKLIEFGDACVVLRGGTGTLLELASVWELINKGIVKTKPVICHSSMWQGIVSIMNIQLDYENRSTELVTVMDNVEEIVNCLVTNIQPR